MEIKITTYTDNEKVYEDKHFGEFSEEISSEKIVYNDKNEKKIKIFIDKIKESVSIEKDNLKTHIGYNRKSSDYNTIYGNVKLDTQLVSMEKKSRNNLVMYEIVYNIFFDRNEKQQNKLKILIKKN
ncbi:hypothetical protein [Gemella sanguinis]|uniref:DUF1934 domain-containing protein n=1 Tax=Gemella sanguinis TaxID=84135 RepID=A0ABX6FIM3_9BACL|nr:hypothetical protein [Gemella sanguinis]QGS08335.1 hypothetical protein FOC50_02650 [Gemella sanguinis]